MSFGTDNARQRCKKAPVYFCPLTQPNRLLSSVRLTNSLSLHLVLRLRGGGKKRKKKTYTKPKKIKKVHKTFKLAALKFYSVSDDGKVKLLRKECPKCGAGVFMATHFDRYACGKCGLRVPFDALEEDE